MTVKAVLTGKWSVDLDHYLIPPFKFVPKLFSGYCCRANSLEEIEILKMLQYFAASRGLQPPTEFELTQEELREILLFAKRCNLRLTKTGERLARELGVL